MAGVVIKSDVKPLRVPSVTPDISDGLVCSCDFRCDYTELAFGHSSYDGVKNDFSQFLFKKVTPFDTINLELLRYGVKVADLNNNDLGTYYPTFDAQPLYVGFVVDWTEVFLNFTGGIYEVKASKITLGVYSEETSHKYRLNAYDSVSARDTVKITSIQDGYFQDGSFDYRDLIPGGWVHSMRVRGSFGGFEPSIDRDIYLDSSFRDVQNRDTVTPEYKLVCDYMPENIFEGLSTNDFLGNQIEVTSYHLFQTKKYIKHPVVIESISDVVPDQYGRSKFTAVFTDRKKNIIKLNSRF